MKTLGSILIAAVLAGTVGVPGSVVGSVRPNDDGIAASPKVGQLLKELRASSKSAAAKTRAAGVVSAPQVTSQGQVAASPKLQEQLNEHGGALVLNPSR